MLRLHATHTCTGALRRPSAIPARTLKSRVAVRSARDASHISSRPSAQDYLTYINSEVASAQKLRKEKDLFISDVVSGSGDDLLQWVDLVLAGGGLLGIAHVGFVCVLEEAGVRFRGVGGTSAGAINAIAIAATRKAPESKSYVKTLELLADPDNTFPTFQDGLPDVANTNALLKHFLGSDGKGSTNRLVEGLRIVEALAELPGIWKNRGLHPGAEFEKWVKKDVLAANHISTVTELMQRMDLSESGLGIREGVSLGGRNPADISKAVLKLVASDIVTQTKAVFPEMANLYYADPSAVNPSAFVRASMSVPLFFQPYKISGIPKTVVEGAWRATHYGGEIPGEATFVDGGTLSNFPISLFDVEGEPLLPTVGCQLGVPRATLQKADTPFDLLMSMINTSTHIEDYDYITKNSIYEPLVATADTNGFGWLDFDMDGDNRKQLFKRGATAGLELLNRFTGTNDTWTKIKKARKARSAGAAP